MNWSIEPAQAIVAKNMAQLKMKAQLFQSHGFANIKYVEAAGAAAEGIIFPCGRLIIADQLPDSNPQKKLLVKYTSDYKATYKEDASTFGGHAYDALTILKAAIERAKSTDPDKIVAAIEGIKNFSGTGGVFNFSARTTTACHGLGRDDDREERQVRRLARASRGRGRPSAMHSAAVPAVFLLRPRSTGASTRRSPSASTSSTTPRASSTSPRASSRCSAA